MIDRRHGKIKAGQISNHISAFWDILPTFCDIVEIETPKNIDGISFLPELFGNEQKKHEYLYWEFLEQGGKQAVLIESWKGVRLNVNKNKNAPIELYNLETDIAEQNNVAADYPGIINNIAIWVYGTDKSLEWHPEHPNYLYVDAINQPTQVWKRGNDYVGEKSAAAGRATRTPSGHLEAFLEAVANIYRNFADTVIAKLSGKEPDELMSDYPDVDDGVRGMVFIDAVVKSSAGDQKWFPVKY